MKVGVSANPNKPAALDLGRTFLRLLGSRAEVVLSDQASALAPELPHAPLETLAADVLVAIGGDGTFLYALRRSAVPLLPVNAGTVGVLAEVDGRNEPELGSAVERLLAGRYTTENRMKLSATTGDVRLPDAVNEYVVHSARVGRMGLFELLLDDRPVGEVRADGLIVASPTGSTAYALSSLGPIVEPSVGAMVLTAIAPFRVEARAVVVDPLHRIGIRALEPEGPCVVLTDGEGEVPLLSGRTLTVHRSPRTATLVRFGSPFPENLRGKRILPFSEPRRPGNDHGADLPTRP